MSEIGGHGEGDSDRDIWKPDTERTGHAAHVTGEPNVIVEDALTPTAVVVSSFDIAIGSTLGRYVVLEKLGSGGMCDVFAVYDRDLARKAAIKIVRTTSKEVLDPDSHRLMREAQTMAQLAHPNIVTVYEIGVISDRPFVAMEYVPGRTLREWMRQPHTWQEVVQAYCEAGEGLVAAHEKGVVHRDFKPENVLLSDKGRVQVTDFGLAQITSSQIDSDLDAEDVITFATQHGTVFGTPAYMSPEQMRGEPADPAADQFCYCVALYEALYGRLPYHSRKVGVRYEKILKGEIEPPPKDSKVPRRIHRMIVKGLSAEPAQRHASMADLLRELRRTLTAGRRWAIAAGLAVAGVAAAVILTSLFAGAGGPDVDVCGGVEAHWSDVWDPRVKQERREAFAELPGGAEVWSQVEPRVDEYAARWNAMSVENCEATRVSGKQSRETYELRDACLERARREVDALVALFATPDAEMARNAMSAVGALSDLDRCSPTNVLSSITRSDAAHAAEQLRAEKTIARAKAHYDLGQFSAAEEKAREARTAAEANGLEDLAVNALYLVGRSQWRSDNIAKAEESLVEAAARASAPGQGWLRAECLSDLVYVVGLERMDLKQARHWYQMARYAIKGLGDPKILRGQLLESYAIVLSSHGEMEEVEPLAKQAFADLTAALPPRDARLGRVYNDWANVLLFKGELDRALAMHNRGLEIRLSALDPEHPDVAESLNNIASVKAQLGQTDEALKLHQRALEIYRRAGDQDKEIAKSLSNIGLILLNTDRAGEALKYFEESLALERKIRGDQSLFVALTSTMVGAAHDELGELDAAITFYREALRVANASSEPNHPERINTLIRLGSALSRSGRTRQAIGILEEALQLSQKRVDQTGRQECCDRADTSFLLAQALVASGRDRERASSLARTALAAYREAGPSFDEQEDAVQTWLGSLGAARQRRRR